MASVTGNGPEESCSNARSHGIHSKKISQDARLSREGGPATAALDKLVECEILPRLLLCHSSDGFKLSGKTSSGITPDEAAKFASLPLELDADELIEYVEGFLTRGVSVESVFIELLAPSARKLGQFWENDSCDFVDVTMGLWRLQEVLRETALRFPPPSLGAGRMRSALFSPMPGEQHSFGSLMVEEVFARGGWDSESLIEPQRAELLRFVSERSFDLVGLTISCDCPSGTIASLVTAIRSVSKCQTVKVLIGGRLIIAHPELVDQAGADGTAADACSALALADKIVSQQAELYVSQS